MSTYQPPGGPPPPEGTPGYVPPQDPWAGGYEPGLASVPTDPLPQQGYHQYPPYQQGDVWSQQTVAHGGGYVYPPPRRGRTGMVILVALAVLVLGGGGGYAAWYVTTQRTNGQGTTPSHTDPVASASTPAAFDPYAVKVGDCLVNKGTQTEPEIQLTPCDTAGSFKVIKIVAGEQIQENEKGVFDDAVTSVAACKDTNYEIWYGYQDALDDAKDLFFCMTNND